MSRRRCSCVAKLGSPNTQYVLDPCLDRTFGGELTKRDPVRRLTPHRNESQWVDDVDRGLSPDVTPSGVPHELDLLS